MPLSLPKNALRKAYAEKRNELTDRELNIFSEKIAQQIFSEFLRDEQPKNIHLFLPIARQKEVDLWFLVRRIWSETQHQIFVPKVVENQLETHNLTSETILKETKWGILEPTGKALSALPKFNLVITPLLYCDNQGNRVGYGKGFYDKFFSEMNEKTLKIGVNFFPPEEKIADVSPLDIPLDFLVTPEKIFKFD